MGTKDVPTGNTLLLLYLHGDYNQTMRTAHTQSVDEVIAGLGSSRDGLSRDEAARRLAQYGPNTLPAEKPPGIGTLFLRQFLNPLVYVLLVAAAVSALTGEWSDAGFIFAVLLINAVIGTYQEYSAARSAAALSGLVSTRARVLREGEAYEIDAREVVPGDIVLLESGSKVPSDLRLITTQELEIDEALLTGESLPVRKNPEAQLDPDTPLAERSNMAFSGTLVIRGRASGITVRTGLDTAIGDLASAMQSAVSADPPLLVRMRRFTLWVAGLVGIAIVLMAVAALAQGMGWQMVFLLAVALAVSAIPEGLPVALTVTLTIGQMRMAKRQVIVKRLVSVEALGSCTFIASDKTGTLTVNELTARRVLLADGSEWRVSGAGTRPEGEVRDARGEPPGGDECQRLRELARAAVLANEGFLGHRDGDWVHSGDAVDVALLVLGHKLGLVQPDVVTHAPPLGEIPFEPENRYSASLNRIDGREIASVKGAPERLLELCDTMLTHEGIVPINRELIAERAEALAEQGQRLIAVASGEIRRQADEEFGPQHLRGLTLLGLVGMEDPPREGAREALAACQRAGIRVAMITGDHPTTALHIARDLGLAEDESEVATGPELTRAKEQGETALDALVTRTRIFARTEPHQKLDIVQSLQRLGHFIAMTGDGANDAPAIRAAHVGVAMGKGGTDVARESADMIITDDHFASIVAGVEEGRIAYANVRKVIFLLISTGAAEIVLFMLALLAGLPLPLLAVQLLWLNLVTNGIQHIALAFEPGEGNELQRPPRAPDEPIFDRLMLERVMLSALVIGGIGFAAYQWFIDQGWTVEQARNGTLLLLVLFENVQVFNARSETRSVLRHNLLQNKLLLVSVLAAQGMHIGAMYIPWLADLLGIAPVSGKQWIELLGMALLLLVVMEAHKWWRTPSLVGHLRSRGK